MSVSQPLDLEEWNLVLNKMLRYHFNIGEEIKGLVMSIRKEMKPELLPVAEEKANYGKIVKQAIRSMWALEYEIDDIQLDFSKSIGNIDIDNLTDDFVEDVMLQSKPLQNILFAIRNRQKTLMEDVKSKYNEHIKDLEPLNVKRPSREEAKQREAEKAKANEEPKPIEQPSSTEKIEQTSASENTEEAVATPIESAEAVSAPEISASA